MMSRNAVAVAWALQARGLSPTAWKILMVLAHRVNNRRGDWDVWPKQQTLADDCELTLSTLKRHLDELEKVGFIIRTKRMKRTGGFCGCTYTLNVKARFGMPDGNTDYRFADEEFDEDDDATLGQIELARSPTGEPARSLTADLAIEPLNREPLKEEEKTLASLSEKSGEQDLFGGEIRIAPDKPIHERIVEEWNKRFADIPGITKIASLSDRRRKAIYTRFKDTKAVEPDQWKTWERIFEVIEGSSFLRGEDPPPREYPNPFRLDLDYVLRPSQFERIFGGSYRATRSDLTHDQVTGRSIGPSEQVGRAAIRRILASENQHSDGNSDRGGSAADGPGDGGDGHISSAFDGLGIDLSREARVR